MDDRFNSICESVLVVTGFLMLLRFSLLLREGLHSKEELSLFRRVISDRWILLIAGSQSLTFAAGMYLNEKLYMSAFCAVASTIWLFFSFNTRRFRARLAKAEQAETLKP